MKKDKRKESGIELAKETIGVGAGTIAGHGILGSMAGIPGMPAAATGAMSTAGAGLNLVNVGQLAKVGMAIPKMMEGQVDKTKKKTTGDSKLDMMLGY